MDGRSSGSGGGDEDHLGPRQRLLGAAGEQPVEVGQPRLDVAQVGTHEPLGCDDRVVDPDLGPLAQEPLRELDVGALAQVVGVALEAQPQHGDRAGGARDDPVEDVAHDELVAAQGAREERHVEVCLQILGGVGGCAERTSRRSGAR